MTSPPAELIPGGLRRECTCGRRIEARGGGLELTWGTFTFGGRKAPPVSVLSEGKGGASIREMTTCWSCWAEMVLRLPLGEDTACEFKALPEKVLKLRRTKPFRSPASYEDVPGNLTGSPITEGLAAG